MTIMENFHKAKKKQQQQALSPGRSMNASHNNHPGQDAPHRNNTVHIRVLMTLVPLKGTRVMIGLIALAIHIDQIIVLCSIFELSATSKENLV